MKNPHIIVGAGRRCLCGTYGDRAISCGDILADIARLKHAGDPFENVSAPLLSIVEDCPDEYEITINSQPVKCRPTISYEDIVEKIGAKPGTILTVTYFVRASNRQGCLTPGQFVTAENAMHITAVDTSRA